MSPLDHYSPNAAQTELISGEYKGLSGHNGVCLYAYGAAAVIRANVRRIQSHNRDGESYVSRVCSGGEGAQRRLACHDQGGTRGTARGTLHSQVIKRQRQLSLHYIANYSQSRGTLDLA